MSEPLALTTCLRTDVGRFRPNNEDVAATAPECALLVLADGMGGHSSGEVAARIATDTVIEVVRQQLGGTRGHPCDPATGLHRQTLLLRAAIETAHRRIFDLASSDWRHRGMGTTLVACLLDQHGLSIAHVGDSRLYRLRDGELRQLTRDHSLIEELIARGRVSREEAPLRVGKNVVTRALGAEVTVDVDLAEEHARDGDLVLLCSDGLTDMVGDDLIRATLDEFRPDLAAACDRLIELALDHGGSDNVSVVLGRIGAGGDRRQGWRER